MTGSRQTRPQRIITGRIASLSGDSGFGWLEAIAITDGRVSAAGRSADILPLAGADTEIWRLASDRIVIPGITDAHLHLTDAALADRQLDLGGLLGVDSVLQAIAVVHARMTATGDTHGWLLGRGWSRDAMGRWPDADLLERVAPGRPVALWSHDHHSRWLSNAALRVAGIDTRAADPYGGRLGRDADGRPDGLLFEDAVSLLDGSIPEPVGDALGEAISHYSRRLAALGVVGVHDPGELSDDAAMPRGPRLYRQLALSGRLPLRVVSSVREGQLAEAIGAGFRSGRRVLDRPLADIAATTAAARYHDGWLKLFADGALGSRSAALLEPYEATDTAGPAVGGDRGMLLRTRDELEALAGSAAAADIAVQIHAIGDAAVRLALDVLAGVPRKAAGVPRMAAGAPGMAAGVRRTVPGAVHRIEHAQLVAPSDIARFAALGVAASMQPCHLVNDAIAARAAWGRRAAYAFPLRSLDGAGALLPLGTDAPVESPDPWPGIAAAVTRSSGAWMAGAMAFYPEQGIPLWRAIRGACVDPARSIGVDDEGQLRVGARADLIVLAAVCLDEPTRPGGALETARPLATLIDGSVVHRTADFEH